MKRLTARFRCRAGSYSAGMHRTELISFIRNRGLAVLATSNADGHPQAALVGVAATDAAEIVFDTVTSSRKYANLTRDGRVALVIGWDEEQTVQLEGVAHEITHPTLDAAVVAYYEQYPDGRDRAMWSEIVYIRVTPTWARYSDYRLDSPQVVEIALP